MNKNKKYRINSKIVTIGVLAVVVLVNLFVTMLVKKIPVKLDMTSEKLYEISDETKEMLGEYDTPVDIYFVAGAGYESSYKELGNIAEVLEKYGQYGKSITYTSIDSEKNPTFGTKYVKDTGASLGAGSVVVDSGDKFKVYSYDELYNISTNQQGQQYLSSMKAEQKINAALRYVSSDTELTAYVINGHNEKSLAGLEEKLAGESYTVNYLNLSNEDIPADASLLVIAAPMVDYTDTEIAKLDAYFNNSGKAFIAFDYESRGLTKLFEYLKSWGLAVNDDVAVETDTSHTARQLGVVLADYGDSEMVSTLSENQRIIGYMPYAKSITQLFTENNGITTETILTTSDKAYCSTDFESLSNTSGSTGKQIIAAAATKQGETPDKNAVIYLAGTTTLLNITESNLQSFGFANYDYAGSVLSYLGGNYEDYSISPKYLSSGKLFIDGSAALILGGIFVILVPLAILIYGIVIWVKRRNL